MYYGGSRNYSNGYGRSHTYNYSSEISSLSSRNPSIQRVLNSEYGIRDRSVSPTRDYTSLSRVTAFRPLSSDSSSALRSSPVSYLNDDFKSRNYYDIQSTSTGMFTSYSPIKKPRRTDYTDYLKPVLSARPMLKSGYIPRSLAERQSVSRPITRDRKLIKFRETSEEVIEKIRRKISWDIPEEISSPLIDEMKENYVDHTNEISSEQPGSRRDSKDAIYFTPGSSPISGSPRTSVSRHSSGDQSSDRPIKPPLRKSSIKNTLSSSIETIQNTHDLKTPLPPPRKKSIGSSQKVRKSRKSSLDVLLSEEKSLNYSKIADDIRRTREESLKRLADSAKESRLPSQTDENEVSDEERKIVVGKESEEVPDRSRRRRRRPETTESETSEEKPPEMRRRRSHYTSQESNESISPTTVSRNQLDEKVSDVTPRAAGRMHRKSVKYKSDGLPPRRLSKSSNFVADHDIPLVLKNSDSDSKDKLFVAGEVNKSDVKNTKISLDPPVKLSDKINQGKVGLEKNIKKANVDNALKSKLEKEEISTSTPVVGGKTYLDNSNNTVSIKNEKANANKKNILLENKSDLKSLSGNKTLKTEKDNKPLPSDSLKSEKLHPISSNNKTSEINESRKIDKGDKIKTDSNNAGEKSLMKQPDSSVNTVVKVSIKDSLNKTTSEINESTKIDKGVKIKTDSNKAGENFLMKQSDSSVNTAIKDSIKDSSNKTSEINESTKIDKGVKLKTDSNKAGEKSLMKQSDSFVNTAVKDSIKDSSNKTSKINESTKIDKGLKLKTDSNKAGEKSLMKQSDSSVNTTVKDSIKDSSNKTSEINESIKIDKGIKIKIDPKIAEGKTLLKQSDSSVKTVAKDSINGFSRTAKKDTDHNVALGKAKPEDSKEEKPHLGNNLSQYGKDNSGTTITNLKSETKTPKKEALPSISTKVQKIKYGENLNKLNEIKQGSSESLAKKLSKPIAENQQMLTDPALKLKPNVPYTKETEEIVVVCKLPKKNDPGQKISIPNEQKVVINIKGTQLKTVDIVESSKESANGVTPKVSQIIPFGQPKDLELKNSNFSQSLGNTEILDVNVTHTIVLKPKAGTSHNLDISTRKNEKEGVHLKPIPDVIKSTVNLRSKDSDDVSDIVKSTISKKEDKTNVKKLAVPNSTETFSPNIKTETDINLILDKRRIPDVISKEKNKKDQSTPLTFEKKLPSLDENNAKNTNNDNFSSVKKSNSSVLDYLGEATALKLPKVEKSCSEVLSISKEPDLIQMTTVAAKTKIDPFAIKKTEEGIKKEEIQLPLKSRNEKNEVEKIIHEPNVSGKTDNMKNKSHMLIKNDKNKTEKVNTEQKTASDKVTNIKEKGELDSVPTTQNVKCKLLPNNESRETIKELCIKNEDKSVISGSQEKDIKKAESINTGVTDKSSENDRDIKHPVQVYKKSMTSPNVDILVKESDSSKTDVKAAVTKQKGKLEPASLSAGDVPNAVKSVQNIQLNDAGVKAVKSKIAETQKNSTRIDDSCVSIQVDCDVLQLPKLKTCEEKSSRDVETLKGAKSEISESEKKLTSEYFANQTIDLKSAKVFDNLKNTGNGLKSETKLENESKIINEKLSSESEDKSISKVLGRESENVCTGNIERLLNVNQTNGTVENSMPKINVTVLEKGKQAVSDNFKLPILHDTSNNLSLSQETNTSTSKPDGLQNSYKGNEVNEAEIKSSKHLDDKMSNENKEPIVAFENKLHEPSGREISGEQVLNLKTDKLDTLRNTTDRHEENSLKQTLTEVIKAPEQIKADKIKQPKLPAVPIRYQRFGLFTRPKEHQNTILESSSSEEESETETDTDSESCEEELPVNKASTLTNGKYPEKNEKTRSHSETSNTSINSNSSNCTTYTTVPGSWDDEYGSPKKIEKSLKFRKYGVDDFIFLKLLGKGSFGKVLLAELKDTQMYFAIKCLKKDVVLEDDDVESTMIERRVLALGTQHPYMCKLYCTFQTKSYLYFVMEYLNGGDLMFHIQESGRFEEKRAMFYGAEIVSALKFLHKRGIVYRDIKLDNIMLDEKGHVRIVDFGMCQCRIYKEECMPSNFCGTPTYIAPEIVLGQKYNQSVDWWSFGVLLYEMLIGRSPFQGTDEDELFWSICNEEPHYPRFLSKEATHILGLLLVKCPSKRLGMPSSPAGDIKDHAFFSNIIWDKIESKQIPPVFKPSVSGPCDTSNFDSSFTTDSATLSPIESDVLKSMDQEQFNGFSYTNPHLTG